LQILDLRGLSTGEAEAELSALHRDSFGHTKWNTKDYEALVRTGLRVVVDRDVRPDGFTSETRNALEDQDRKNFGLHPKYGFRTLWFHCVAPSGMMFVVAPTKARLYPYR
jgi:hypothetical protein